MSEEPVIATHPITFAERLKTLQRHSETNKWLAGGFSALIFFTYDKINCQWLRVTEAIICISGAAFLFAASVLFKRAADLMTIRLEGAEATKARKVYHSIQMPTYPWAAGFFFISGTGLFAVYALLFFFVNELYCPEKEKKCECIVQVYCDTIKCPPCPPSTAGRTFVLYNVLFDFGKWDIRKEAEPALDSVVQMLQSKAQREIIISAHTDSIGSFADNIILSSRRAASVKNYIVKKGNISETRITPRGYGEIAPVESNATPAGRQQNRRVEFTIVKE